MAIDFIISGRAIPWTEEPGRLQSQGRRRAGHDLATEQQHVGGGGQGLSGEHRIFGMPKP